MCQLSNMIECPPPCVEGEGEDRKIGGEKESRRGGPARPLKRLWGGGLWPPGMHALCTIQKSYPQFVYTLVL